MQNMHLIFGPKLEIASNRVKINHELENLIEHGHCMILYILLTKIGWTS